MARHYTNDIDDESASFPASVYTPIEWKNRSNDYVQIDPETFTVPGSGYDYAERLQFGILKQTVFTVFDSTESETLIPVPWGQVPGAAEVAVAFDLGVLQFHSSREGNTIEVTYTPLGTPLTSDYENRLQLELVAIEDYILNTPLEPHSTFISGVPSTTSGYVVGSMLVPDNGTGARSVKRITAFAYDRTGTSGQTRIYVTPQTTATGGDSVDLPSTGTDLQKARVTDTCDIALDTSGGYAWVNVFCTDASAGHQNITVEILIA